MRCLNRMHEVIPGAAYAEGCVRLGEEDVYSKNVDPVAIRRRIATVFQKPNPFSKAIYDNVAWDAKRNGYRGITDELIEGSPRQVALWEGRDAYYPSGTRRPPETAAPHRARGRHSQRLAGARRARLRS